VTALRGYRSTIAKAIDSQNAEVLALVEHLMRTEHSTLDALSLPKFNRLAREAFEDAIVWEHQGGVHGMTLAEYCRINGLTYPNLRLPEPPAETPRMAVSFVNRRTIPWYHNCLSCNSMQGLVGKRIADGFASERQITEHFIAAHGIELVPA